MKTIDMGNNESTDVSARKPSVSGTTPMLSVSRTFKTRKGAEAWLARRGFAPSGERLAK